MKVVNHSMAPLTVSVVKRRVHLSETSVQESVHVHSCHATSYVHVLWP